MVARQTRGTARRYGFANMEGAAVAPPLFVLLPCRGSRARRCHRRLAGIGKFVLVILHALTPIRAGLVGAKFLNVVAANRHTATAWRGCLALCQSHAGGANDQQGCEYDLG